MFKTFTVAIGQTYTNFPCGAYLLMNLNDVVFVVTQGYNGWGSGLYGYSWDMMVHNWGIQHVKIRFVSKPANDEGYLDPEVRLYCDKHTTSCINSLELKCI